MCNKRVKTKRKKRHQRKIEQNRDIHKNYMNKIEVDTVLGQSILPIEKIWPRSWSDSFDWYYRLLIDKIQRPS